MGKTKKSTKKFLKKNLHVKAKERRKAQAWKAERGEKRARPVRACGADADVAAAGG